MSPWLYSVAVFPILLALLLAFQWRTHRRLLSHRGSHARRPGSSPLTSSGGPGWLEELSARRSVPYDQEVEW